MPYEVSFKKLVNVSDPEQYINECCWGGDVVRSELLPAIASRFDEIQSMQEDWGWFIWFRKGSVRLAIDIFCDEPSDGSFRIRLTSRKKALFFEKEIDTPELEEVREIVASEITRWAGEHNIERVLSS